VGACPFRRCNASGGEGEGGGKGGAANFAIGFLVRRFALTLCGDPLAFWWAPSVMRSPSVMYTACCD
jgi:hypothetical protein